MQGYASAGNDKAVMTDSTGSDTFRGRTNYGQLVSNKVFNKQFRFDELRIYSTSGSDTLDAASLNYNLIDIGPWTMV